MNNTTLEKLRSIYETRKNNGARTGDSKFWSPTDGKTTIRILPGKGDDEFFYKATAVHAIEDKKVYCPKHTNGSRCPICDTVSKLFNSKLPDDIAMARKFKARKKFYANVIVRGKEEEGPKIWSFGIKMYEKLLGYFFNEDYGDLTHLQNGYDFIVEKTEKEGFPNYDNSMPRTKPTPAGTGEQIQLWMSQISDINGLVDNNLKKPDELQAILLHEDDEDSTPATTEEGSDDVDPTLLDEIRSIK